MDSLKNEVGYLVENEADKLKGFLQNIVTKVGIIHAEKIAKKYQMVFSADSVLKNIGLK